MEEWQVVQDHVVFGDSQAVGPFLGTADQVVVVQDALGEPGRARGVHDEDGIVRIHGMRPGIESRIRDAVGAGERGVPGDGSRIVPVPNDDDALQNREIAVVDDIAIVGKRDHLADHRKVVDGS